MKSIKIVLFSFALVIAFTACSDESSTLGGEWVSSDFSSVVTDTCAVKLSTVESDSVETSNLSSVQVGHYKDNNVGDVTTEAFVEYANAYFLRAYNVSYTLDSATIKIKWQGDFVGDTTKVLPINIYELSQNITLNQMTGGLYNSSAAVPWYPTKLAQINTYVYPSSTKKQYEYRLPDSIGQRFLDKVLNSQGQNVMKDQNDFRQYFRGLAFVPCGKPGILPNIQKNDSSLVLTVYYRGDNSTAEQKLVFKPTNPSFTKVIQDVSGSKLAEFSTLPYNNAVPSYDSGNVSFVQSTTGYYTKVEFPTLSNLLRTGQMVSITSAILYLYPAIGTYSNDTNPLPKQLSAYTASFNNATTSQLKSGTGSNATAQTGNLQTVIGVPDIKYYTYDLTSYMQSNLSASDNDKQNIQLTFPTANANTSCKYLMFSNPSYNNGSINYRTKVVIKYTTYNSNKVM